MRLRRHRLAVALAATFTAGLLGLTTGCSGDSDGAGGGDGPSSLTVPQEGAGYLEEFVTWSQDNTEFGQEPTDAPAASEAGEASDASGLTDYQTTTLSQTNEDGAAAEDGKQLTVNLAAYDLATATELSSSWVDGTVTSSGLRLNDQAPAFAEELIGAKEGDRLALVIPAGEEDGLAEPAFVIMDIIEVTDAPKDMSSEPGTGVQDELLTWSKEQGNYGDAVGQTPEVTEPKGTGDLTELQVEVIDDKSAKGKKATADSTLKVNYVGMRASDGAVFDSSWERGEPAEFELSGVIPGWTQGLTGQKAGTRVALTIPGELAYGTNGQGADIGPNEALFFLVDVIEVK